MLNGAECYFLKESARAAFKPMLKKREARALSSERFSSVRSSRSVLSGF